jgi:hypothetical protein
MKKIILIVAGLLAVGTSWGFGDNNQIVFNNTVGLSWNDNYRQTSSNKISTGIITETPELTLNLVGKKTSFSLRYGPSLTWFTSDQVERQQTVQHQLNASLNQYFSPRLSLMLSESFRRGVQPELLDRNNALVQPDASYNENSVNGVVGIQLRSSTRLDVSGRHYILSYDTEQYSTNSNYSILSGGVSLRQEVSQATTVSGNLNYDNTTYRRVDARSASTVSLGMGVDHTFGPRIIANASGGWQLKNFESSLISGQNSPYGNLSLTYIINPRVRLTGGASYSLWEADISPYASQERLTGYFALGYDITSRLLLNVTGGLTHGKYLAEQVYMDVPTAMGGNDNLLQAGIRLAYQLNRHNWLDVSYSHNKGSSDLRDDFDVNAYSIGWRFVY